MTRGYLKENKKGELILKCGYCAKRYKLNPKFPDHIKNIKDYNNFKYFGYVCSLCKNEVDEIVFNILMQKGKI